VNGGSPAEEQHHGQAEARHAVTAAGGGWGGSSETVVVDSRLTHAAIKRSDEQAALRASEQKMIQKVYRLIAHGKVQIRYNEADYSQINNRLHNE
jgi:membrane protein involved in colicin uptake